jgi:hypothetical protein
MSFSYPHPDSLRFADKYAGYDPIESNARLSMQSSNLNPASRRSRLKGRAARRQELSTSRPITPGVLGLASSLSSRTSRRRRRGRCRRSAPAPLAVVGEDLRPRRPRLGVR